MRGFLVIWHRWFGLAAACFLFLAGLTGAVIAWNTELDAWLNPQLFDVSPQESGQSALALADAFEAKHPGVVVTWLPLQRVPGESQAMSVQPRTGSPAPGYDQIWLDPTDGHVLGSRTWDAVSLDRKQWLPMLYRFHYTLMLPVIHGVNLGIWLMGLLALAWSVDCVVALWLSFPKLASWRKSLAFRWSQRGYKLIFDLHRSTGVWIWLFLLAIAVSSFSLNLPQLARSMVGAVSTLSVSPYQRAKPPAADRTWISREQAVKIAEAEARRRGWQMPSGGLYHFVPGGIYGVGFFEPGDDHGGSGLGNPWIYVDDHDGSLRQVVVPGAGSAGDVFFQAQFPIHSGRIIGLPGRILVSFFGLCVAILCVTGIVIWARKRRARRATQSAARVARQSS